MVHWAQRLRHLNTEQPTLIAAMEILLVASLCLSTASALNVIVVGAACVSSKKALFSAGCRCNKLVFGNLGIGRSKKTGRGWRPECCKAVARQWAQRHSAGRQRSHRRCEGVVGLNGLWLKDPDLMKTSVFCLGKSMDSLASRL